MDREAWRAIVHSVAKSRTQVKRLSMQHTRPMRWREEEVGGNSGDRSCVGDQARQELPLRRNSKRVEERSQRESGRGISEM